MASLSQKPRGIAYTVRPAAPCGGFLTIRTWYIEGKSFQRPKVQVGLVDEIKDSFSRREQHISTLSISSELSPISSPYYHVLFEGFCFEGAESEETVSCTGLCNPKFQASNMISLGNASLKSG